MGIAVLRRGHSLERHDSGARFINSLDTYYLVVYGLPDGQAGLQIGWDRGDRESFAGDVAPLISQWRHRQMG